MAAKALDVKLGNFKEAAALRQAGKGSRALRATVAGKADDLVKTLAPDLSDIGTYGHTNL